MAVAGSDSDAADACSRHVALQAYSEGRTHLCLPSLPTGSAHTLHTELGGHSRAYTDCTMDSVVARILYQKEMHCAFRKEDFSKEFLYLIIVILFFRAVSKSEN